jgi:Na+/melibiose symporter-like transporter
MQFLTFVRLGLLVSSLAYLARLAMNRFDMLGTLLSLLSVAILAGGAVAAPMLRRFGILPANWIGIGFTVAMLAVLPFAESSPTGFAVVFVLSAVMIGVSNSTVFLSSANAAELQALRTGQRNEGVIVSAVTISLKVGMALGMSLIAFVLAGVDYTPTSAGPHAVQAIRWTFYGGQIALVLLQLAVLPLLRPATGER